MLIQASSPSSACYALLDDAGADHPHARLLQDLYSSLECDDAAGFAPLLQELQSHLQAGRHAVLLLSYELGAALHGVTARVDNDSTPPFAQALIFKTCTHLATDAVQTWLAAEATSPVAGITDLQQSLDEAAFTRALQQIHAYIEAGHTYQVNYTYRLHFSVYGGARALYQRLRARQPVPYGALICLPDGRSIVSLSPELFVRHQQGTLLAQPMKGTAAASADAQENANRARALAQDSKNRAENLMIVDLLRNDLGRVAVTGSVQVEDLFAVQQHGRVLQMTTRIRAQLAAATSLPQIMHALYPCGSITGAPKRRTMEIIRELEPDARGIYTGAIGWFAPPAAGRELGDFCLSVPIRTLHLQAEDSRGLAKAQMGVGAGIVYDSVACDEFQECALKARFLSGLPAPCAVFETMRAEQGVCTNLSLHLARLAASCQALRIEADMPHIRQLVQDYLASLDFAAHPQWRIKLQVEADGRASLHSAPLTALTQPVKLLLSGEQVSTPHFLLAHKTTLRHTYDAAWQAAERQGAFDQLFCNAEGHVTEGGRSNLFVQIGGQWYTPPVSDGLLPGIMRGLLLTQLQAVEKSLNLDDVRRAEQVLLCNALRGALVAKAQEMTVESTKD